MRLPNLAGTPSDTATERVLLELEAGSIPVDFRRPPSHREVRSDVRGCLRMAGGVVVTFDRAWKYYVVQIELPGEGMPLKEALDLHNNSPRLGYDDGLAIRVDGHAAALPPTSAVTLWHVDTVEGLAVIAAHLRMWSRDRWSQDRRK